MNKIVSVLLVLFFVGFFSNYFFIKNSNDVFAKLTKNISKELSDKFDLHVVGFSEKTRNPAFKLGITFVTYKQLNKENARILVKACTNFFVDYLNSHINTISAFCKYPVNEKNIEIIIFSNNGSQGYFYHPLIHVVSQSDGKIIFRTINKYMNYQSEDIENF